MQSVKITAYKPSTDETYMNLRQLSYFREILVAWRHQLLAGAREFIAEMQDCGHRRADVIDQGSMQAEKERNLKTRKQQHCIIAQIDRALAKIDDGTYGYCEATGEEIGLSRLLVMPAATMCVEAREQLERTKRMFN